MNFVVFLSILSILAVLPIASSYRILCIFSTPSRSHNNLGRGFVNALLKAGHEVTWASPFPDGKKVENLTVIHVQTTSLPIEIDIQTHNDMKFLKEFTKNISTVTLNTKELKDAVVNTQFDAVITEWFFSEVDAGYAAIQKVPWIMVLGSTLMAPVENLVDDARSVAIIPMTMINNYPIPMNFWQRTMNYLVYLLMTITSRYEYQTRIAPLYQNMFGPLAAARGVELPPFSTALDDISILFVNSHPSIAPAQSLPPNVIDIAGYHIDENIPPLPKDLQDLLDSSKHGVVYFSMGSVLKPTLVLGKIRQDLIKMLGGIPHTVLWKFEEKIEGLPKNVHVRSWMPQSSILAHPNVKLFITHGGQLSSLEAIYHGVPLLSIPVFGDQPANAQRAVRLGIGLMVPYSESMTSELTEKLKEMLQNDSYSKRVKYLSKLFRNRPVPPSKLISHYVELAIESRGAHHLRSSARFYSWYERWMLDAIFLVIMVIILAYALVKKTVKYTKRKIKGDRQKNIKKKQ